MSGTRRLGSVSLATVLVAVGLLGAASANAAAARPRSGLAAGVSRPPWPTPAPPLAG